LSPTRESVHLVVEGVIDFEGRRLQSLAFTVPVIVGNRPVDATSRLLVDADTYLPVAQTQEQGDFLITTVYEVEFVSRSTLATDFFDPRALGYLTPREGQLAVLDDPNLGVQVYWPGRTLSKPPSPDAELASVVDLRFPPGKNTFGNLFFISYTGGAGTFRLDYWPPGKWEEFQTLVSGWFPWAKCGDRRTVPSGPGEIIIYRGFEPQNLALPPDGARTGPPPTPNLYPNGCPNGPYDRFMAEVRLPGVTVTINAPSGVTSGREFGDYDTEEVMEIIARSLRPRALGE
jgi:hypothetical protein